MPSPKNIQKRPRMSTVESPPSHSDNLWSLSPANCSGHSAELANQFRGAHWFGRSDMRRRQRRRWCGVYQHVSSRMRFFQGIAVPLQLQGWRRMTVRPALDFNFCWNPMTHCWATFHPIVPASCQSSCLSRVWSHVRCWTIPFNLFVSTSFFICHLLFTLIL